MYSYIFFYFLLNFRELQAGSPKTHRRFGVLCELEERAEVSSTLMPFDGILCARLPKATAKLQKIFDISPLFPTKNVSICFWVCFQQSFQQLKHQLINFLCILSKKWWKVGHYCSLFTRLVIFVIYYPCLSFSPLLSIIVYIVVYHCFHCCLSLFSLLINIPACGLDSLDFCRRQGCLHYHCLHCWI